MSIITMQGDQVLSFLRIHPIKCGIVFNRTKQLIEWTKYWDSLQEVNGKSCNLIRCNADISSTGDIGGYLETLFAHIFDGGRELELIIDEKRYTISKLYGAEPGFKVHYYVHNTYTWVNQYRLGYQFKMHPIALLDILYERVMDGVWDRFNMVNIIY